MAERPPMTTSYSSLPTPHPPGDWVSTPDGATYKQDEGVLEAAGRDAQDPSKNRALGAGLLGGAVGLVLGGIPGALAGATLGTAAGLEEQGLQRRLDPEAHKAAAVTPDAVPDLSDSPAQRMVGGQGGSEALTGLLAGGAGAHLADREVQEPSADKIAPAELSGLPVNDETAVNMSPAGIATPAEEKKDGFSNNQKLAAAGAGGLGAGALTGAALSRNNDVSEPSTFSKFDSPYTPGLGASPSGATPGPPTSTAPTVVGATAHPSLQDPIVPGTQSSGIAHNPEYTPGPEAAGLASTPISAAEEPKEDDESRLKQAAPYAAAGAAGLGAGAGAAALLSRDDDEGDTSRLQSEVHDGPTSRSAEVVDSYGGPSAPASDATTLPVEGGPILDREVAQPRDLDALEHGEKHTGRETAAAAALGAIGGATGAEALHKAGAGKDEAEMPAGQDPTAALMGQLGGKDPSSSRFVEGLDSPQPASAIPPRLTSRFSDATVDTISDRTIDGDNAPLDLADQRAVAPVPLFREGSYLNDQEDRDNPRRNHKISPEALAATAAVGAVPGFVHADPSSTAFQDFAHLSQPPTTQAAVAAPVDADPRELAQAQEMEKEEQHPHGVSAGTMAGVGAGAGAGGLAAAYVAEHRNDSSAGGLPTSPKHLNLRQQLGEGDYSPSTPSSTRAIKGSPTNSGAATPASFTQQGQYTPPMREQQAGFMAAAPYADQSDYYAGTKDHQQTFSPQQQQQEQSYPHEQSSDDASRQYQQSVMGQQSQYGDNVKEVERTPHMGIATVKDQDGRHRLHKGSADHTIDPEQGLTPEQIRHQEHLASLAPVERSPHMKIATRKDSIGHKKLHKKSLGDPTAHLDRDGIHSQGGSPVLEEGGSGSPARRTSIGSGSNSSPRATQGEGMWNSAVANVVNDETANRGGHRPGLVTIDSEDRRDPASDRTVGFTDPTSHNQSPSSPHTPNSPAGPNKLRRKSLSQSGGNPNPRYGPDGFPRRDEDGNEVVKQGFVSKLFGHKKSPSKGSTSPRTSSDGVRRTSGDEQGRASLEP